MRGLHSDDWQRKSPFNSSVLVAVISSSFVRAHSWFLIIITHSQEHDFLELLFSDILCPQMSKVNSAARLYLRAESREGASCLANYSRNNKPVVPRVAQHLLLRAETLCNTKHPKEMIHDWLKRRDDGSVCSAVCSSTDLVLLKHWIIMQPVVFKTSEIFSILHEWCRGHLIQQV